MPRQDHWNRVGEGEGERVWELYRSDNLGWFIFINKGSICTIGDLE